MEFEPVVTEDTTKSQTISPEYTNGAKSKNGDLNIVPKTTANKMVSSNGCNNVHNIPKNDLRYFTFNSALTKCDQKKRALYMFTKYSFIVITPL